MYKLTWIQIQKSDHILLTKITVAMDATKITVTKYIRLKIDER